MTSVTDNRTTEKPVSGTRVWDVIYISSTCPHCGYEDNRTKADELDTEEMWYELAFCKECDMCDKEYLVEVNDDDR